MKTIDPFNLESIRYLKHHQQRLAQFHKLQSKKPKSIFNWFCLSLTLGVFVGRNLKIAYCGDNIPESQQILIKIQNTIHTEIKDSRKMALLLHCLIQTKAFPIFDSEFLKTVSFPQDQAFIFHYNITEKSGILISKQLLLNLQLMLECKPSESKKATFLYEIGNKPNAEGTSKGAWIGSTVGMAAGMIGTMASFGLDGGLSMALGAAAGAATGKAIGASLGSQLHLMSSESKLIIETSTQYFLDYASAHLTQIMGIVRNVNNSYP